MTFMETDHPLMEGYTSKEEIAKAFGVHPGTIFRWVRQGLIPKPVAVGRQCLYKVEDVRAVIEGGEARR